MPRNAQKGFHAAIGLVERLLLRQGDGPLPPQLGRFQHGDPLAHQHQEQQSKNNEDGTQRMDGNQRRKDGSHRDDHTGEQRCHQRQEDAEDFVEVLPLERRALQRFTTSLPGNVQRMLVETDLHQSCERDQQIEGTPEQIRRVAR